MEFSKKLQELRKQKGLTQEELAQKLYVSRTAISKWESGRGYPSIDSLKEIAKFFCVTVDQLLSGEEVLTIAQEDQKQKQTSFRDLVFALLDLSVCVFFFLPIFGEKIEGAVREVSLLELQNSAPYLKGAYLSIVIGTILFGLLTLVLQNCHGTFWQRNKSLLSILLSGAATFLMILSQQPYGAVLVFLFLIIKLIMLLKKP